jgi:hypothetical protein
MKRSGDPVIARDRVIGGAADSDQDVMVEHTIDHCHPERAGAHAGAPNTRVFRVVGWSHATASRRTALQILFAAIREIFDESAYERFLLRTNAGRSIASYRDFTHERDSAMLKKPRCC